MDALLREIELSGRSMDEFSEWGLTSVLMRGPEVRRRGSDEAKDAKYKKYFLPRSNFIPTCLQRSYRQYLHKVFDASPIIKSQFWFPI